jgi:hypothetical protein
MAHPATVVVVDLDLAQGKLQLRHEERSGPAMAAFQPPQLTLVVDPQLCHTAADVRAYLRRWADNQRMLRRLRNWRVIQPQRRAPDA